MPASSPIPFRNRSLWGCGFLLLSLPALGQRGAEISVSGGASLAQARLVRHGLPDNFRLRAGFNTGAALRLTFPVSTWLGLGLEQRITGMGQTFTYRAGTSRRGTGLGSRTVYQYGARAVFYDVWLPAPRLALDLALTGSYTRPLYGEYRYQGPLWHSPSDTRPSASLPLVWIDETRTSGTVMAGVEALLRYEVGARHALLLIAAYQRGLRPTSVIRSTRVEYLDAAGNVQQGSFVLSTRASYATLQLGYGFQLGRAAEASRQRTLRTPRYGAAPDDDELLNGPGTDQ